MKDKSINRLVENNKKNLKNQKIEINKSKNQNNINKVSTNFSNDNNINNNSNKINLKDSLEQLSNDNLTNNKKNKNFQKIYENIQRYSNISKLSRRIFNSRDKILKDNSFLNKVKSKNELATNNIRQKQKQFFHDKEEDDTINNDNERNVEKIIYKKNNISKNKNNINTKKNKKGNNIKNFIKIEELNEIISSDNEADEQSQKIINIESNSESTSKLDEKEIISNTLTIKDELVNYESDKDTNREKKGLKNSMNFNNELALILDKHLTQIDFNKNNKYTFGKIFSSHSPPPKKSIQGKKSQIFSLNLNTIDQIKENPFSIANNNNNQRDIPTSSAKINKINKNISRKNHLLLKGKKELMLINYLKQNFFKKEETNNNAKNSENKNEMHRSKNDINNYESNEGNKYGEKYNISNMRKKNIGNKINEELKINIDFDNFENNNKIKYKEYKLKNNLITNGIIDIIKEIDNNHNNINIKVNPDNSTNFSNLNSTLNKKNYNNNNNSNEKNYVNFFKNVNFNENITLNKNNKNSISIENNKNYNKKFPKKLYRNNSQNNDIKKNESIISLESSKNGDENSKHIYQIKINNLNLNSLNKNPKKNKEAKASNIKIENIELNNNKLRKNIPSPQHRIKEKTNVIKKSKVSPYNNMINNNYKLNNTNNLFKIENNIYKNNNENMNNNIQNSNINEKERTKSNSNIESIINQNNINNFSLTCKEKTINEFLNKEIQNMNKFPSKKNIKCINKNINPQKYKGTYKIKPKKPNMNENNMNNTNNNCNANTSTSKNNNSIINLEENDKNNNKSPKLSKNNINFNNSANKFIILNKNKRNIHNINYNNEEITNNSSINNYINSNSYSTADKNSFIHITNSNVTKMKNKMNNNYDQNGINQNYSIHPKNLFSSNNNIKCMINNSNSNLNQKNDNRNSNNNSTNKITNSNSNKNLYNDKNKNNNNNNLSRNIESDKKVNIFLYNNINNDESNNKKVGDNMGINKSPEIIKKSSTTMKNNNININPNNRYSINGNQVNSPLNANNAKNIMPNSNNFKKVDKKVNKINNKVMKKTNGNQIHRPNNKNNINNDDIFMDGQIPTVADENPNVNSLKIMKYNKCTYTNKIISQKLTKIFCVKAIRNKILIFLKGYDLFNLSLVNHFFNDNTISAVHKKIIKKILNNKEKTIKRLWKEILNKSPFYISNNASDEIYLNYLKHSDNYDEEIKKDLLRTLPKNILFQKGSNNYKKLFNVLKAYSNYNKKIGYGQGMNFIVAKLIIFYGSEKQSFLYLDALFTKLNFSEVVGISNGLEQKMHIIQFLLNKYCPKVINFMKEKEINHEIFTASWLITLFSKNFENNKLLLIIWNFSIIFGWKFIYLFTISIFFHFEKKYLKLDLYGFTQFMKKIFKSKEFEENFNLLIQKTFEYMIQWKKLQKEIEKNLEVYKMKTDTESGTEIIVDSFDEDTIIQ